MEWIALLIALPLVTGLVAGPVLSWIERPAKRYPLPKRRVIDGESIKSKANVGWLNEFESPWTGGLGGTAIAVGDNSVAIGGQGGYLITNRNALAEQQMAAYAQLWQNASSRTVANDVMRNAAVPYLGKTRNDDMCVCETRLGDAKYHMGWWCPRHGEVGNPKYGK